MILIGVVMIVCGIFTAANPYSAWYLEHGWRYRDAEPSDAALLLNRVGGVLAIIFGAIFLFL